MHEQHGGRDPRVWDQTGPSGDRGTAKIICDSTKCLALGQFQAGLYYTVPGVTEQRPITTLKLQSIKTGEFASDHNGLFAKVQFSVAVGRTAL